MDTYLNIMPKKWLITGGCGFIGVNLVKTLASRGHLVRVLDNLSAGSREDLAAAAPFAETDAPPSPASAPMTLMAGDIRRPEDCQKAIRGMDVVVHLAAQTGVIESLEDPMFDCMQNVSGALNMLMAARDAGVSKFIFASSAAPLGDAPPPVDEMKVPRPISPYGASKLAGEAYCSAFHGAFGLNATSLRFFNVYGPYSFKKGSVIAIFFRRALAGEPLIIYGDGEQTRDYIHTADLCDAILLAAERDAGGEVFQLATGLETSVNVLALKVRDLLARDGIAVSIRHEPARPGEILRNYANIDKARRMLGFKPAVTLEEGLEETWEWFKSVSRI